MLFASGLGEFWGAVFWIVLIGGWILYKIGAAYDAHAERQKEENLKHTNPEVYAQLKKIEHERQMMAHEQMMMDKRMKHDNIKTGVGIASQILRIFSK